MTSQRSSWRTRWAFRSNGGWIVVYDHEPGVKRSVVRKAGSGINRQRRTKHQHEVGQTHGANRCVPVKLRQHFPKEGDVGFEDPAVDKRFRADYETPYGKKLHWKEEPPINPVPCTAGGPPALSPSRPTEEPRHLDPLDLMEDRLGSLVCDALGWRPTSAVREWLPAGYQLYLSCSLAVFTIPALRAYLGAMTPYFMNALPSPIVTPELPAQGAKISF